MPPQRFGDNGIVSTGEGIAELIEDAVHRWTAYRQIRHVRPVGLKGARGLLAGAYAQIRRDFLLAGPFLAQSQAPEILAGFWCAFRESLVAGPASRAQREAIAQGVAQINQCPYCIDVHSMMLDGAMLSTPPTGADTLACREWAIATRTPAAAILRRPPFPPGDAAQMIGTALVFHYLNRIVNVFLGDSPLPAPSKRLLRGAATSMLAKRIVSRKAAPGESLSLLPSAPVPSWLEWANENEFVAGAFARFHVAVETAARETLSGEVRSLVESRVGAWNGEDPGLDAAWLDDALAGLDTKYRAAGRLILLSALASYRVDDQVVAEFREHHPSDADLIVAVAWGSYAAMRRTASWL